MLSAGRREGRHKCHREPPPANVHWMRRTRTPAMLVFCLRRRQRVVRCRSALAFTAFAPRCRYFHVHASERV